ncbi:NAD(P)/FAD-dependent oxidoreductase [Candidatus Woesearchaeota archaeon]|nr:NAD(P)/FAD-dependent oxidoreductase [Candidatus Woesearchaeota archaeon]
MRKIIVGGGPIGLYVAARSAESTVFDQKKQIGRPVQCTGLLTTEAEQLLGKRLLKDITLNKITQTTIIGPTTQANVQLSSNYVIDNSLFEERLADLALRKGNEIRLQQRYEGSNESKHRFKDLKTGNVRTVESTELIGADGPTSQVRKQAGLGSQESYVGMQARIRVKEHENKIVFYPHIGVYAWYVPETEHTARVGLATKEPSNALFTSFLKRFPGKIIEKQGGRIPMHRPRSRTMRTTGTHRTILLGDAAGHIKNTTGGGLIMGMRAAKHYLATKKDYRGSPGPLRKELYTHFLVHNLLFLASHHEWDKIISAGAQLAPALEQIPRDNARKLILPLATNKTILHYSLAKVLSGKVKLF